MAIADSVDELFVWRLNVARVSGDHVLALDVDSASLEATWPSIQRRCLTDTQFHVVFAWMDSAQSETPGKLDQAGTGHLVTPESLRRIPFGRVHLVALHAHGAFCLNQFLLRQTSALLCLMDDLLRITDRDTLLSIRHHLRIGLYSDYCAAFRLVSDLRHKRPMARAFPPSALRYGVGILLVVVIMQSNDERDPDVLRSLVQHVLHEHFASFEAFSFLSDILELLLDLAFVNKRCCYLVLRDYFGDDFQRADCEHLKGYLSLLGASGQ